MSVWVQPYTTVLEIKEHTSSLTGAPVRNMRLFFKARRRANDETVASAQIAEGNIVLYMQGIQGGGGNNIQIRFAQQGQQLEVVSAVRNILPELD